MLVSVLLSGLVLGFADPGVGPTAEDRAAYTAEQAKVGRDAAAHVRLALWCESRGMMAERTRELSLAVLNQPGNAMARGLLAWSSTRDVGSDPRASPRKLRPTSPGPRS